MLSNKTEPRKGVARVGEVRQRLTKQGGDEVASRLQNATSKGNGAMKLRTFEIAAAGFDGGSDETDDRVFWVQAETDEVVRQAIDGTGATFHHDVIDGGSDIDFRLPADVETMRSTLNAFIGPRKLADTLSISDVIANITEVLNEAAGEGVARIYNAICSNQIGYDGDSAFSLVARPDQQPKKPRSGTSLGML